MPINRERYEQRMRYLSYLINDFILWQLARVRQRFDGDVDAALILGEIAHYNVRKNFQQLFSLDQESISGLEKIIIESSPDLVLLKSSNTLSISNATGIPRETVRRKIQWLEQRGWVLKGDTGALTVTATPAKDFADFNFETLERFIATADIVRQILEPALPDATDPPLEPKTGQLGDN
jgi:hypothetical protein